MPDGEKRPETLTTATPDGARRRAWSDPKWTAKGEPRAAAPFDGLEKLWINTGTQCNIECRNCYIKSSPTNDRYAYITVDEAEPFIDEAIEMGADEIGFTGGEPFMNPGLIEMASHALEKGVRVLILTNAMRPMMRPKTQHALKGLIDKAGDRLTLRISLDHFTAEGHDGERGAGAFAAALAGVNWLVNVGARIAVAGRAAFDDNEQSARRGYQALFDREGWSLDAAAPCDLVLFPEMDDAAAPPEITESCWSILGTSPGALMCATSRMIVKEKGAPSPSVRACTLIPYDDAFRLGETLNHAARTVALNHPSCATFCVLGGASCSPPAGP